MTRLGRNPVKRGALGGLLLVLAWMMVAGCESAKTSRNGGIPATAVESAASRAAPTTTSGPTSPSAAREENREPALSDIVQLTSGFDRAGEAYFSQDTHWIVFQAAPAGQSYYDMYVARLKKQGQAIVGLGRPVRVSPDKSWNSCGYFSPDGKTFIFASTGHKGLPAEPAGGYQRQGGNYRWQFPSGAEIYSAGDWREQVEAALTRGGSAPAVDLAQHAITNNNAYDAECGFSPDGKWIVFGSTRDGDGELYAMRADGSDPVRLTNAKGYDGGPFFSPDGKRIVYRSDRKGNDLLQVFIADLAFDGDRITGIRDERQLTDDANVNWGPYWHPDGKHLVYATSVHGHANYEVYWMRDDGSGKTRVTNSPGFDGLPVFSADGNYLMWSSKRTADKTTQVFAAKFTPPK
jgi:TolB protein